jgi:hypothetical protein
VVDAAQGEDLHLEELAEFGFDLFFLGASAQTVVQVFHFGILYHISAAKTRLAFGGIWLSLWFRRDGVIAPYLN